MKYFGKITSMSQISSGATYADGDVFYVGNDKRFVVYDGETEKWELYDGTIEELVGSLGNTVATVFTEPLDTSGVVKDIRDLPLHTDVKRWTCFRIPKYNVCFVNVDNESGWLLYVENYGNLKASDVIDNCESDATDKPLSAKQGKVLWGKADGALREADVVNSLDSDSTNKPLSAAQGKALYGMVNGVESALAAI